MTFARNIFTLAYPKGANRVDLYDFLRGVAMIIVMMQHSGIPGGQFLLTFHMPLFFFLSGMVVGGRELPSFAKYVWSKFKRLMIPYFTFGFMVIVINFFYFAALGREYNGIMAMKGVITGQYGFVPHAYSGLYWFLFAMFMADMMVYPINKYMRDNKALIAVSVGVFLGLSYLTTHLYPVPIFTIEKAFMGAAFILVGELSKPLTKYLNEANLRWKEAIVIIIAMIGVLVSVRMNGKNVLMYLNQFGDYDWFLLGAVSGIVTVMLVTRNIYKWLLKDKRWPFNLVMWTGFYSLVMFPVHLEINGYLGRFVSFGSGSCILRFILMFAVGIPLCNLITNYLPWMVGLSKQQRIAR